MIQKVRKLQSQLVKEDRYDTQCACIVIRALLPQKLNHCASVQRSRPERQRSHLKRQAWGEEAKRQGEDPAAKHARYDGLCQGVRTHQHCYQSHNIFVRNGVAVLLHICNEELKKGREVPKKTSFVAISRHLDKTGYGAMHTLQNELLYYAVAAHTCKCSQVFLTFRNSLGSNLHSIYQRFTIYR